MKNGTIFWYGAKQRPAYHGHAAVTVMLGRMLWHDRSKYMPHQGHREMERRRDR